MDGVEAASVAPRKVVKSHSGKAISGSWPGSFVLEMGHIKFQVRSKGLLLAWVTAQASGAPFFPFLKLLPPLAQEAFPLLGKVSLQ